MRGAAAVVAVVLADALVLAPAAGAAPIDDARTQVAEAQRAADAAAARYEDAVGRVAEIGAQIDDLRARIDAGKAEVARLGVVARRRAVAAYTGRDGLEDAGFILDGGDPLDEIRREKLLARTKEREDTAAADLAAATDDLAHQRSQLEARRVEQERAVAQAEAEQATVQTQLKEAQGALDLLEEQLRREQDAQRGTRDRRGSRA